MNQINKSNKCWNYVTPPSSNPRAVHWAKLQPI